MTVASHKKHQRIASLISASSIIFILLFYFFSSPSNGRSLILPVIAYAILSVAGYVYLYIHSDKDKRFGLLMLPVTLMIIAICSYVTTARFD